jgi:adenosylhomocysteine nucleosidase
MDADGVTLACATAAELRAARKARVRSALVGLGAASGVPDGPLVSFGLAGALRDDLPAGTVLDATRVVDSAGAVLWEGGPLGIAGARLATILAADSVVEAADERRRLHERTGADAADLESGPLARTGRLHGVLRVVSDTPKRPLGALVGSVGRDGRYHWRGVVRGLVRSPRSALGAARALNRLAAAARSWSA